MNSNFSPETQIFVKTTCIFLEELLFNKDNNKLDYSYIIIDEVHERDLYVDLVLVLLKIYFHNNPNSDIKVILMIAKNSNMYFYKTNQHF